MNTTDEDDNETDPSIVVHTWTVPNSNGSTRTNPTETHETSNLTTTDKSCELFHSFPIVSVLTVSICFHF